MLPEPSDAAATDLPGSSGPSDGTPTAPWGDRRYWAWAQLMQRAFDVDVLACPRCGGRLRLIATIDDPHVIHEILAHLGLPPEVPHPDPPEPPPAEAGSLLAHLLA